jgi:hypothetical protein
MSLTFSTPAGPSVHGLAKNGAAVRSLCTNVHSFTPVLPDIASSSLVVK